MKYTADDLVEMNRLFYQEQQTLKTIAQRFHARLEYVHYLINHDTPDRRREAERATQYKKAREEMARLRSSQKKGVCLTQIARPRGRPRTRPVIPPDPERIEGPTRLKRSEVLAILADETSATMELARRYQVGCTTIRRIKTGAGFNGITGLPKREYIQ